MLIYMFYFVPFYAYAIYSLLYTGGSRVADWALIIAGAAAQVGRLYLPKIMTCTTTSMYDDA